MQRSSVSVLSAEWIVHPRMTNGRFVLIVGVCLAVYVVPYAVALVALALKRKFALEL